MALHGAGSERTSAAIAPGSTEYGSRGGLEAGLSQTMGMGGGAPSGGGGAPGMAPPPENALGALMSGAVSGGSAPLTDGISFGPGAGPPQAQDPMLGDRANRLRLIATQAASPQLRAIARAELRRMSREPI